MARRSRPSKVSRSAVTRPGKGTRPIIASMEMLLPEPDSPTTPRISPASRSRLTSSTARSTPPMVGKRTQRLRISTSAMDSPLQLGIERVAQPVAEQVEGEHRDQDDEAGEGDHPPGAQHEFARIGEHGPPFRRGRLGAEAEETERRGVEDGGRDSER